MDIKQQVYSFFEKCDELKKCKFILATSKLKDILKCIVNCPDLYALFSDVTQNFNYPAAKAKCLVTVKDGMFTRSYLTLPHSLPDRLAFIFCLLVEFDAESINFNDFLRKYFPEDGSYYNSYHAFCDSVIKALRDGVESTFAAELSAEPQHGVAAPQGIVADIDMLISEEKQFLNGLKDLPEDEKEGAIALLTQLYAAVRAGNEQLINALVFGYNYFVLCNKCVSDNIETLISSIAAYEQQL